MATILIAEDKEEEQYLLERAFKMNNITHPLLFFSNGIDLLEHLEKIKANHSLLPGFIMLDLDMPLLDGKEILTQVKADSLLRRIPILILSGSRSPARIEECYKLGASCYIIKPDTLASMAELMKQLNHYWIDVVSLPDKPKL